MKFDFRTGEDPREQGSQGRRSSFRSARGGPRGAAAGGARRRGVPRAAARAGARAHEQRRGRLGLRGLRRRVALLDEATRAATAARAGRHGRRHEDLTTGVSGRRRAHRSRGSRACRSCVPPRGAAPAGWRAPWASACASAGRHMSFQLCGNQLVVSYNLHAIEQTQLRRQHRVEGVGRPAFPHRPARGPGQLCCPRRLSEDDVVLVVDDFLASGSCRGRSAWSRGRRAAGGAYGPRRRSRRRPRRPSPRPCPWRRSPPSPSTTACHRAQRGPGFDDAGILNRRGRGRAGVGLDFRRGRRPRLSRRFGARKRVDIEASSPVLLARATGDVAALVAAWPCRCRRPGRMFIPRSSGRAPSRNRRPASHRRRRGAAHAAASASASAPAPA